ncbi:MAG TPA: phosphoglycolate phosphatase [Alphaproteobacteria bacterium]|nr:phosphoglycolate phosphatase [Alphaproteobacteria bacterium]
MTSRRLVVFDLDGTLIDTAPDLTAALNHVLTTLERPTVPEDSVRHMVGHGARMLLRRGLAASGPEPSDADVEALMPAFLEYYGAHVADLSAPFPGMAEALDELAAAGAGFGICTNKPEALSVSLIQLLGLAGRFPVIVGADTLPVRKPDPAPLVHAVARLGGALEHTVYVGDSETDVKTARAAGVPVVVVSWGYTPIAPAELGGDTLITQFSELAAAVRALS